MKLEEIEQAKKELKNKTKKELIDYIISATRIGERRRIKTENLLSSLIDMTMDTRCRKNSIGFSHKKINKKK